MLRTCVRGEAYRMSFPVCVWFFLKRFKAMSHTSIRKRSTIIVWCANLDVTVSLNQLASTNVKLAHFELLRHFPYERYTAFAASLKPLSNKRHCRCR